MNVSSKPSSSSSSKSSSSSSKTSSVSKSKSSSSVKSTTKTSRPTTAHGPKDTASVSKDVHAKPNGAVPNFKSWAMSAPQAPQAGAKPVPNDPAPRVAPKPAAPEAKAPEAKAPEAKAPEAKAPEAKAPEAKAPAPPAPKSDYTAAKAFDDASWATAQARHTAEAAQKAGNLAKAQSVANAGTKALTPLNPLAAAGGSAAFGMMAVDSYKKGNYGDAALQAGNSAALGGLTAAPYVKGGELLAKGASRAAPALGGALQAYQGIKSGDTFDTVSGGVKIAGAAMMATGFGAPVGSALIIGSYMADLARWGYQKYTGK